MISRRALLAGAAGLVSAPALASEFPVIGGGLRPETRAFIGAMTTAPSGDRVRIIDTLVRALNEAGVWSKLGNLYVLAAHDAQAARINWVAPGTGDLSTVNSPTFLTDRGYTGDGATSYLVSGAALRSPYAQNSAHIGIWVGTNVAENGIDAGAAGTQRMRSRNATDNITVNLNNSTNSTVASVTDSRGHTLASRTGASAGDIYKNGVDVGGIATTAVAPPTNAFRVCAGDTSFSTKRMQAAHGGEGLNATEALATYNALLAYMTAVGAA